MNKYVTPLIVLLLMTAQLTFLTSVQAENLNEVPSGSSVSKNKVAEVDLTADSDTASSISAADKELALDNSEVVVDDSKENKKSVLLKSDKKSSLAPPISPLASSGKVALGLLVVIFCIFLLAYIFRRYQQIAPGSGQLIQVLANQSVGVKEKIALIQVGDNQVLVGITSQSINPLLVLSDQQKLNLESANNKPETTVNGFQDVLRKALLK